MIPLFVNLTILVGLIATVGMAVYSYQRSAETVSLAQRNAARMEQVGYAIRSGLRPALMNGAVLVPLGDPDGPPVSVATKDDGKTAVNPAEQVCLDGMAGYLAGNPSQSFNQSCRRMAVPRWLVSDDRTPWGARYAFCPYAAAKYDDPVPAQLATATGIVRDNANATYRIRTVQLRGRPYVLQSDAGAIKASGADAVPVAPTTQTEEVVGFLLSPPPQVRDQLPRCQDVAKVNGAWLVLPSAAGAAEGSYPGSVVPILSRGIGTGQVANQGEVVIYAADRAMGTGLPGDVAGTGNDPAHAMALKDALDLWHLTPWRSTTIRIAAGSYAFSASDTVPGSSVPRLALTTAYPGRSLSLESYGGAVTLAASDGLVDLALGVEATIDSVSLGAGVQLRPMEGSSVRVTNAALHHVRVDGGDLSLGLGTSVAADGAASPYSAVDVISGRLRLSGGILPITGGANVGIQLFGGDLVMNGTGIAATLAPGGVTVAPAPSARVLVAPDAAGNWPSVTANGAGGQMGGDMVAVASTGPGGTDCNAATGTCAAVCRTPAEGQAGIAPLRIAVQGSCVAAEAAAPEMRASLTTSINGLFVDGNSATWHCAWRPGDQYMQSPVAGGSVRVDAAPYPVLTATARCAPNPSVTAPAQAAAAN